MSNLAAYGPEKNVNSREIKQRSSSTFPLNAKRINTFYLLHLCVMAHRLQQSFVSCGKNDIKDIKFCRIIERRLVTEMHL